MEGNKLLFWSPEFCGNKFLLHASNDSKGKLLDKLLKFEVQYAKNLVTILAKFRIFRGVVFILQIMKLLPPIPSVSRLKGWNLSRCLHCRFQF